MNFKSLPSILTILLLSQSLLGQNILSLSVSNNTISEQCYSVYYDDINEVKYVVGSLELSTVQTYNSNDLLSENTPAGALTSAINNNVTGNGGTDFFLAKIGSDETVQWIATGGGMGNDYLKEITMDAEGNIYVTGAISFPAIFYDADGFVNSNFDAPQDFLGAAVCKYSSEGSLIWVNSLHSFSDNLGIDIEDTDNGVCMSGYYSNSAPAGSTSLNFFGFNQEVNNLNGFFIAHFTYAGVCDWYKTYTSTNIGIDLTVPIKGGSSLSYNGENIFFSYINKDGSYFYSSNEDTSPINVTTSLTQFLSVRSFSPNGNDIWQVEDNLQDDLIITSGPFLTTDCNNAFVTFSFFGENSFLNESYTTLAEFNSGTFANTAFNKRNLVNGISDFIQVFGGDSNQNETYVTDISIDESGLLAVCGSYTGNIYFSNSDLDNPPLSTSKQGWIHITNILGENIWKFILSGINAENITSVFSGPNDVIHFSGNTFSNQVNESVDILPNGIPHSVCGTLENTTNIGTSTFGIVCPPNVSVNSTTECGAEGIFLEIPAILNACYLEMLVNDAPVLFPMGNTSVVHQATSKGGLIRECTQIVTVIDVSDPTQLSCPLPATLGTSLTSCSALLTPELPSVTGVCSAPAISNNIAGDLSLELEFNLGTTNIEWTVIDEFGDSYQCTTQIIIVDNVTPQMICNTFELELDANGSATLLSSHIDGGSADNCSNLAFELSQSNFTCNDIGSNTITLSAMDDAGNQSSCQAVVTVIELQQAMILNAGDDFTVCANVSSIDLNANSNTLSQTWSGGNGTFEDENSLTTIYIPTSDELDQNSISLLITAPSASSCSSISDVIEIFIDPIPSILLDEANTGCPGSVVQLDPIVSNSSSTFWSSTDISFNSDESSLLNSVTIPLNAQEGESITIELEASSVVGVCSSALATQTIVVDFCSESEVFKIPTGFSPNGDNINDSFYINLIENYAPINLQVYNRWGILVYESDNYSNDWTGEDIDGNALPVDSYFAVVSSPTLPQETFTITINK